MIERRARVYFDALDRERAPSSARSKFNFAEIMAGDHPAAAIFRRHPLRRKLCAPALER